MLTICWVAGYSTCVLPVNMPVASAVHSLQSCLRFREVCAWLGLKLTEPANCDLRPHDFWRMAAKNLLRLDVKWPCITSSCGSGGTGRRRTLRMWETANVYQFFQQLTLGCVRQNWGVIDDFGESFGESHKQKISGSALKQSFMAHLLSGLPLIFLVSCLVCFDVKCCCHRTEVFISRIG